jgi:TonB family protein
VAPPAPVTPPPEPTPEPPKPVVTPEPTPPPKPVDPVTPEVKPSDEPTPLPVKPKPSKIEVDLTPVKAKPPKKHVDTTAQDEERQERQERAEARQRAREISRITGSLHHNLSSSTEVDMPGDSPAAYANYGQVVQSIYEQAWITPDNTDNDNANPKVHVVIARDGTVISAHIIEPSGDAAVDASVRRVLDRVRFIRPFPEGATENERSYNINFNLKAKRMLE